MSNCKITIKRNVRGKVQTQRYDSAEALFRDLTFEEIPKEFLPKEAKKELIFGIPAGEGRLTTNLDSSEFEFLNINPTNPEHSNEGRLYLGTESAVPGVLIPSAVRKKDMSEVDLNKEVPLMQQLKSFISQIADATVKGDQATASQRVQDLRNIIYVGSKAGIPINFRTENNGPISSTYLIVSRGDQVERILIKESELITDNSVEGGFSETVNVQKSVEEVSQELTQALVNVKAPFQVNKNDINGKWNIDRTLDYNNVLAEADVLTTNLEKNEVSQAYFVMNPLNSKLEEVKVNNSPIKTPKGTGGVSSTDSPLGREVTIEEGTFRVREGNKVYDAKNNPVTDNKTVLKVITHDYLNNLSKEELDSITFKGNEISGIKSLHMGQIFILMPNNRVWAGNRYLPTTDSTHILIMEMNEKRQAGFSTQSQITPEQEQQQKAGIERRRQEEIGTKEQRSYTDDNGVTWTVQLQETNEGKVTRVRGEKDGEIIGQYENRYSKELSNEKIYEAENADEYQYTEIESVEVKGKRADKINAKYDAELTEINNQITPEQKQQAQQVYSQYLDSLNKPNTKPILQNNQKEQVKKFVELQERLNNKEFLEGAKNAYENSEELKSFGTQEEYNDYIARVSLGIIKNPSSGDYNYTSQVKDIVYHGTSKVAKESILKEGFKEPIDEELEDMQDSLIWFSKNKYYYYKKEDKTIVSIPALINIKSPNIDSHENFLAYGDASGIKAYNLSGDGLITQEEDAGDFMMERAAEEYFSEYGKYPDNYSPNTSSNLVFTAVPTAKQIHILGSKQDIQGFKDFTQEDTITEEIPLFSKPKAEPKETRVRKRPRKGGVINTALDSKQSSEMTAEQIQEEINRQKEYQEKNCPEIKS